MTGRKLGLRKRIGLRLFSDLYAEKIAEHKLRTLFWECTLRCNLACRHCGSDCRVDPGVPDMPLADFLKVLDEEVTPHNRPEDVLLIFSGGEVLVRSDLEEAGREARSGGRGGRSDPPGLSVGYGDQRHGPRRREAAQPDGCRPALGVGEFRRLRAGT